MSSNLNISNVTEYLETIVKEVNPDIDLREGTAVRDFIIKPLISFMQPLIDETVRVANSQSLTNATTMTETDMDELIANIFVTRRGGTKATGTARILLSSSENSIEIPVGTFFTTSAGLRYLASQRVFVTSQQLALNLDGNFFFLDVPITAEGEGTEYNAAIGEVSGIATPPVNFIRVTNAAAITNGVGKEDNLTLKDRAETAITVRDLVSGAGIITQILEAFQSVVAIQPIGFGDVEMIRDIVTTDGSFLQIGGIQFPPSSGTSIGGHVDAYIKPVSRTSEEVIVSSMTSTVALRPQETDDLPPSGTLQYLPTFKRPEIDILEIEELDAVLLTPTGTFLALTVDYTVDVTNPSLKFSSLEKVEITLTPAAILAGSVGKPYAIRYLHSADVPSVQTFIDLSNNRTVSASILAKHAVPNFIDISVTVTQPSSLTHTVADYQASISNFIDSLPLGKDIEASDIVDAIYDTAASSSDIKVDLPFTINGEEHFVDGTISSNSSQNSLVIDRTKVHLSRNITVVLVVI